MSDLITPDKIYVDLMLFRDFNIGTLLSFLEEMKTTRPEVDRVSLYRYMLDNLPEYQDRKFDDMEHHFSKFGLTTKEIQHRLHDQEWSSRILHTSPITPYITTMKSQIAVNINHSNVAGKKNGIDFFVNTYPLKLDKQDQHIIGLFFAQELGVNVTVIYRNPKQFTLEEVIEYDEMYTYHLADLFNNEDISNGYTALKFISKRLFTPRLFGNKFIKSMHTEKEELIVKTRCDILTTFKFFHPRLCSAISPESKT